MGLPAAGTVVVRAAVAVMLGLVGVAAAVPAAQAAAAPVVEVSGNCGGQNAEVEEATAAPALIYQVWIGCGGIGFARSTDGGASYGAAVEMPGSGGGWDPAIAVGPAGTVYVSYMLSSGGYDYPVVSASFDQGATFTQTTAVRPPASGNWGDRDFITVGPDGTIYLTWDYGPDASKVQLLCSSGGSCAYSTGDLNAVVQKSTDGGLSFGPITPIGPGYPIMGGYSAPVLVAPSGQVDALYWGHQTDPNTYALSPGYEYFTDSTDGGSTWSSAPQQLDPALGSIALPTWWIDGDLAVDSGGTLYATWDTQTSAGDTGYLTYSTDGGTTWSAPVRVTPDTDNAMHNVEVTGGGPGIAYVAWQTSAPSQGYATYLQTFSTTTGLVGTPTQISTAYGNPSVWPGDTFGLATLSGNQIALSWGSANGTSSTSEIYATVVPATDFTLSASPASGTAVPGSPATTTVTTTATGGDTETVSLSATGLPTGTTAAFNPASVTPGGSSTLTLSTSAATPPGSYPITITGTGTSNTHSTTYTLTVTARTNAITNGGFETGTLTGWSCGGQAAVCSVTTSNPHSGTYAAILGSASPTNGTSSLTQTFTAPAGSATLSFWYNVTCPDTVNHDWATATLKDNTTATTKTVLPKTCATSSGWKQITATITAGHSYTLTLTSKDDNHPGNPTHTEYDDVATS
ncbi:MAG TPA: carbohydrate binding domain-containing protein [Streptosporangiaceae bacterium]|nr:carbohydrate binding domain-containing protein [Streptosporangiaceae bacterium]